MVDVFILTVKLTKSAAGHLSPPIPTLMSRNNFKPCTSTSLPGTNVISLSAMDYISKVSQSFPKSAETCFINRYSLRSQHKTSLSSLAIIILGTNCNRVILVKISILCKNYLKCGFSIYYSTTCAVYCAEF